MTPGSPQLGEERNLGGVLSASVENLPEGHDAWVAAGEYAELQSEAGMSGPCVGKHTVVSDESCPMAYGMGGYGVTCLQSKDLAVVVVEPAMWSAVSNYEERASLTGCAEVGGVMNTAFDQAHSEGMSCIPDECECETTYKCTCNPVVDTDKCYGAWIDADTSWGHFRAANDVVSAKYVVVSVVEVGSWAETSLSCIMVEDPGPHRIKHLLSPHWSGAGVVVGWFYMVMPNFDEGVTDMGTDHTKCSVS